MELCRGITVFRVIALGVLCGMAASTKFTGVLLAAMVPAVLLFRVVRSEGWSWGGRTLGHAPGRLVAAALTTLTAGLIGCFIIWLSYGLRHHAIPGMQAKHHTLDLQLGLASLDELGRLRRRLETGRDDLGPNASQGLFAAFIRESAALRVLPEAWIHGLLFVQARSQVRDSYLNGEYAKLGWWYYFPLTMAYKLPTGTMVLLAGGGGALLLALLRRRRLGFATLALGLPAAIYLATAMSGNLNLGIRHMLPLLAPMLILAVLALLAAIPQRRPAGKWLALALSALVLIETVASAPNFVAFFNLPTRTVSAPIELLGDSNLDWGQDLKALGEWQQSHRDRPMFLAAYAHADPSAYGVNAAPLLDYPWQRAVEPDMDARGYFVMTASALQGLGDVRWRPLTPWLKSLETKTILNKTVYIFDWPPATPPPEEAWKRAFPGARE
jgi:hypothetical protein